MANHPLKVKRPTKTLRELTLEKMREAILSQHFKPGDRLVERTLCEQLGVSRTVVREVLRHLESEGLIQIIPHQGPIVTRLTPETATQIYEIRAYLEAMAGRACAELGDSEVAQQLKQIVDRIEQAFTDHHPRTVLEATSDFYEILFQASGKSVAHEIVQSLNARISYLRSLTISSHNRGLAAIQEMRHIQQAISKQDPEAAYQACKAHVDAAAAIAQRLISNE